MKKHLRYLVAAGVAAALAVDKELSKHDLCVIILV